MLAFRSVVSVLLRALGDFSLHPSRPALRAAASGGRPRAGSDTMVTREPASPSARVNPAGSC
jgi:hypothetical protein